MYIFTDIERFPGAEISFDVVPRVWNKNVNTFEVSSITGRLVEHRGGIRDDFLMVKVNRLNSNAPFCVDDIYFDIVNYGYGMINVCCRTDGHDQVFVPIVGKSNPTSPDRNVIPSCRIYHEQQHKHLR